jgi:hypothetical protein
LGSFAAGIGFGAAEAIVSKRALGAASEDDDDQAPVSEAVSLTAKLKGFARGLNCLSPDVKGTQFAPDDVPKPRGLVNNSSDSSVDPLSSLALKPSLGWRHSLDDALSNLNLAGWLGAAGAAGLCPGLSLCINLFARWNAEPGAGGVAAGNGAKVFVPPRRLDSPLEDPLSIRYSSVPL